MVTNITKKWIENIAYTENIEFGEKVGNTVLNLISLAIDDMSQKIPYVNIEDTIVQPINETFNASYIPGSDFVYFLGIRSPQIEQNSLSYSNVWHNFKKRFKEAWIQSSRKARKKKEKQQKAGIVEEKEIQTSFEKYNLNNFMEDFQYSLTKNLSNTSIVYRNNSCIRIIGKDDFGVNTTIIIYPTILEDDSYKMFISRKKGYEIYNFNHRVACLNEKLEKIGENYIFIMKIFNYLFREFTKQPANQILLETIMYNSPESFFKGDDIYACFVKLINYLRFNDISSYKSVLTEGKTIFDDITTKNSSYQYSRFLKAFDKIELEKTNK